MAELPMGTVTLLFSDIEGSTQLVQSLGVAWAGVLEKSRTLCREAWSAHDGHEMGTEGDSFFVVFATAEAAVHAASEAQRALADADWPDGVAVSARIGIHTGTPDRLADGYVGLDVHLAARVAGAAHGGQIVVSSPTAALVQERIDSSLGLIDLGSHELKDIREPVRLFQMTVQGLPQDFPPLRTRSVTGHVPRVLTDLIGRDGEAAELRALMTAGERLVTLTGPGGSGKTRLAIGVATALTSAFEDGVHFVPLAPVVDGAAIWGAVAQVLELPPEAHSPAKLVDHIRERRLLLVLDNLEQIEGSAAMVEELLLGTEHTQVLATSRSPLHVAGEREHAVPPLDLPHGQSPAEIQGSAAVRMFCAYAGRVRPGFALDEQNSVAVAELCRALDGLPLALELAAARVKMLTPAAILARLDRALDLSSADASRVDRQRTLRQTIDWSYQLLSPQHQRLLDHLGVFAGGATLTAIEGVLPVGFFDDVDSLDLLTDLVDASLVTVSPDAAGEPRFGLLETIRRYALDRLAATGALEAALSAHTQFYVQLAADLFPRRRAADFTAFQREVVAETGNFGEVIARQLSCTVTTSAGTLALSPLRSATLLTSLARHSRSYAVADRWARAALDSASVDDTTARAGCLALQADLLVDMVEYEKAFRVAGDACRLARSLIGNPNEGRGADGSIPLWFYTPESALAQGATLLSEVHLQLGDLDAAAVAAAEAMSASSSPEGNVFREQALGAQLELATQFGRYPEARAALESKMEIHRSTGSEWHEVWYEIRVGLLELLAGNGEEATARSARALPLALALGDPDLLVGLAENAVLALDAAGVDVAARAHGSMSSFRKLHGLPVSKATSDLLEADAERHRSTTGTEAWDEGVRRGLGEPLEEVLQELLLHPGEDDLG